MAVTKEELREKMGEKGVVVLNVLSAGDFDKLHIRGSRNEPLGQDYGVFVRGVEKRHGKKSFFITYGADVVCATGPNAAKILRDHGFKAEEYLGGMEDWNKAGWPTDGTQAKTARLARS
jgi:rhodanese-related sulfurtransferase